MNLKKTLIAAAAASLLGGAALAVASSSRNSSDLFMANVEALADGEWTPPTVPCAYAPLFYCPIVVVNDEWKSEFFWINQNRRTTNQHSFQ